MMNVLGCLDLPTTGTYTLDGEAVAGLGEDQLARVRNRKIGFIFQSYYLMPRTTIADNVAQPLIYRGLAPAVRRERANAALARVGLEARDAAQAQRAVRRPAATRGHRARAGRPPERAAGRRAHGQPRQQDGARDHGRVRRPASRGHDDHHRDARCRRSPRTAGAWCGCTTAASSKIASSSAWHRHDDAERRAHRRRQSAAGVLLRAAGVPALRARQHPLAPHAQLPHHARRHHRRGVGHLHRLAAAGPHAVGDERVPGHRRQHVADPLAYVAAKTGCSASGTGCGRPISSW